MGWQFDKSGALSAPAPEVLAEADADSAMLVLDRGVDGNGAPYWAYIAVKPSLYAEFMRKTAAHERLILTDYGALLEFGNDSEVPQAVREKMQREYGFNEQYMAMLTQKAKTAQAAFLTQKETQRLGDIVAMLKKNQQAQ